jgi:hypothetical protein
VRAHCGQPLPAALGFHAKRLPLARFRKTNAAQSS